MNPATQRGLESPLSVVVCPFTSMGAEGHEMKLIYTDLPRRAADVLTTAEQAVEVWHCTKCSCEITRLAKTS